MLIPFQSKILFSLCNYANGVILVFLLLTVNIFHTISSSNKVILEHTLYTFCIHTIAALDLWKEHLLCFGYYYWYCNIVLYHIISYLYLYGLCSSMSFFSQLYLTVSWRRSLSHRNFLYDREVRHERVNLFFFGPSCSNVCCFYYLDCPYKILQISYQEFILICLNKLALKSRHHS